MITAEMALEHLAELDAMVAQAEEKERATSVAHERAKEHLDAAIKAREHVLAQATKLPVRQYISCED